MVIGNPIDLGGIKNGFNFGLGTCIAGALFTGTVVMIKTAWIYKTTMTGATTGLAFGGPVGAAAGATVGIAVGIIT